MSFQLTPLSKNLPKPCMFLLILCLGTVLALSCTASCFLPPSSGSVEAAWFHPFSRSTTAPTWFCAAAPAPSPSESGRGTRWLPSAALRLAQLRTSCLAARVAAADHRLAPRRSRRDQVGLVLRPAGLFTFFFSGAATRRSRNRFPWISHFGVPETITYDRGPQFTSNLWFQLCQMLNISHKQTTSP
jgi:hypothetical protein